MYFGNEDSAKMKSYDLHDKAGRAFAFEVPSVLMGDKPLEAMVV